MSEPDNASLASLHVLTDSQDFPSSWSERAHAIEQMLLDEDLEVGGEILISAEECISTSKLPCQPSSQIPRELAELAILATFDLDKVVQDSGVVFPPTISNMPIHVHIPTGNSRSLRACGAARIFGNAAHLAGIRRQISFRPLRKAGANKCSSGKQRGKERASKVKNGITDRGSSDDIDNVKHEPHLPRTPRTPPRPKPARNDCNGVSPPPRPCKRLATAMALHSGGGSGGGGGRGRSSDGSAVLAYVKTPSESPTTPRVQACIRSNRYVDVKGSHTYHIRRQLQTCLQMEWNGGSSRKCWSRDVGVEHDPQLFLDMLISVCSPLGVIVDVLPPG